MSDVQTHPFAIGEMTMKKTCSSKVFTEEKENL